MLRARLVTAVEADAREIAPETLTWFDTPVSAGMDVSVAVTVCRPGVLKLTASTFDPFESVVSAGRTAAGSLLVK